ncbi:MAG: chain-length determining protein [Prevotella sp.]|nr:chain-length determining protein [Prevotella sp.]
MEEKKELEVINLRVIAKKIREQKKSFIKPLAIVFVISAVYIFSIPRYYSSDALFAPEIDNGMAGGTLSSIAASFGFDLNDMQTSDAITPLLYPDLMEDYGFVTSLFPITVETEDGDIHTDYYDYLRNKQKKPWWGGITDWISDLFPKKTRKGGNADGSFDPYNLSFAQETVVKRIQDNIVLNVDKKTGVISISVKDQDPKVCRTLADSVMVRLQAFITDYRTNKARIDVEYYTALADSAKEAYEQASRAYSSFADAYSNVVLEKYRTKLNDLENDMGLKYNTYTAIHTQLQAAKGKVQERTPAFTKLKGAAIPIKPAGPKRMIFVLGMLFLTFTIKAFWIVKKDLHLSF